MEESKLLERLRLIEALHAGATSTGEKVAAAEARKRIQARLASIAKEDPPIEFRFSLVDGWSAQAVRGAVPALRREAVSLPGPAAHDPDGPASPRRFVEDTLWPEFQELSGVLRAHLEEVTDRLISSAIHADVSEASEVNEPARLSSLDDDD